MQIPPETITEIKRFNRNVDWLKKSKFLGPQPIIEGYPILEEWLSVKEAMQFVNRSRSWLARITVSIKGIEQTSGAPMMQLYKGADWKRETNKILYKRASLENLKKAMEMAGDAFDSRLASKKS